MITGMGATIILAGFIAPYIALAPGKQGIAVITPVGGSVMEAFEKDRQGVLSRLTGNPRQPDVNVSSLD
jgi:hypothetical protein